MASGARLWTRGWGANQARGRGFKVQKTDSNSYRQEKRPVPQKMAL